MINIEVFSEEKAWAKKLRKKELFFKKICKLFPRKYQFPNKRVSLTLLLSNNRCIKKLNKNFRNKNKSTDILSFPLNKKIMILSKNNIIDYDHNGYITPSWKLPKDKLNLLKKNILL